MSTASETLHAPEFHGTPTPVEPVAQSNGLPRNARI